MRKQLLSLLFLSLATVLQAQLVFVDEVSDSNINYSGTNTLLFYTNASGETLWRSDGTEAGTFIIETGLNDATNFTAVGNLMYFIDQASPGSHLWVSDGTAAGTVDLIGLTEITGLTAYGNLLAFVAESPATGRELWISDGTSAGTVLVKDVNPGVGDGLFNSEMEVANGILYFTANNGVAGKELWKSDGSTAGTSLVKDLAAGGASSNPLGLTKVGDLLFFFTKNPNATLWKTDGSSAGTVSFHVHPYTVNFLNAAVVNGIFYFGAFGSFDSELWRSDGTTSGTSNIYTGFLELIQPINVNNTLAFTVNNEENWYLYRSTGMPGGHTVIDEGLFNHETAVVGKYIYYPNPDSDDLFSDHYPNELWQSDLTVPGTRMIRELYSSYDTTFAHSENLIVVGNSLYFTSENTKTNTNTTANLWKLTPENSLVSSFTLVNSVTDTDIMPLEEGDTIYTDQHVNVRANVYGTVGSVKFFVNGSPFSLESVAPYALAGDNSGNYNEWMKPSGNVQIRAVPYTQTGAGGTAGSSFIVNVKIINPADTASAQITFTLVNAISDTDIGPITNGQTINLASLPTNKLNIRANSTMPGTESVVFDWLGTTDWRTENTEPYALFADNSGDYNQWTATVGTYSLGATPYTGNNGTGTAGVTTNIVFYITNTALKTSYTYPNPANDQVTVSLAQEETTSFNVSVLNLTGQVYFKGQLSSLDGIINLDLSDLNMTTGIYLIKIESDSHSEILKMYKK